jgi:[1-hydroxy-2-(trimethylamino)ethyl]phosphonate dioxygenase
MTILDEIMTLFAQRGAAAYHGENVSQTEHALQAAALAVGEGAPDHLVIAALLHDVGHLLDGQEEDLTTRGFDGRHEEAAYFWLTAHFNPSITEPIRLHVAAKRYLCAVEPAYLADLSPASQLSLSLQGGPMKCEELTMFEANSFHHDAVRLRRWDDMAKVRGLSVPSLEQYRERFQMALTAKKNDLPSSIGR